MSISFFYFTNFTKIERKEKKKKPGYPIVFILFHFSYGLGTVFTVRFLVFKKYHNNNKSKRCQFLFSTLPTLPKRKEDLAIQTYSFCFISHRVWAPHLVSDF